MFVPSARLDAPYRRIYARWESWVEAQLRDLAFLLVLVLLFVLTLEILSLTGGDRRRRHRGR